MRSTRASTTATAPVLAVSSAGMLIRRDVWDQVGGFDANLPLFRDDIDFCWRVHAAGYDSPGGHRRGGVPPRAVRPADPQGAGRGRPSAAARPAQRALRFRGQPAASAPMLAVMGGCVAGSLVRAAYFLVTKQQRKAAAHLGAVAWLLRHPVLLWRARRRRAAHRKHGYAVLRGPAAAGPERWPGCRTARGPAVRRIRLREQRAASRRRRRARRRDAAAGHAIRSSGAC